jgi:hypothetical protein
MTARAERESAVHDGYAIASLVLSLVWFLGVGSLLAVIFGNMSDAEAKRQDRKMSGFAAAGQVLGVLGVIGAVAVALLVLRLPCAVHTVCSVSSATVKVGHIPGTSHRDLPRVDEKRRDLNHRSDRMHGTFVLVKEMLAQDPAYRPAHPPSIGLTCGLDPL